MARSDTRAIDIVKRGRPSKLDPDTILKLEAAFNNDFTVEEACIYAEIGRDTFYRWFKNNTLFRTKMLKARAYPDLKAKEVIMDAIKRGEWRASGWRLERRQKHIYSLRTEQTGTDGGPIQIVVQEVDSGGAKDRVNVANHSVHKTGALQPGKVRSDGGRKKNRQDSKPRKLAK